VETVRDRDGRRLASGSTRCLVVPGGSIRRTHREGTGSLQIHYLNKPPPDRPVQARPKSRWRGPRG
jgi:hypothetical protein